MVMAPLQDAKKRVIYLGPLAPVSVISAFHAGEPTSWPFPATAGLNKAMRNTLSCLAMMLVAITLVPSFARQVWACYFTFDP